MTQHVRVKWDRPLMTQNVSVSIELMLRKNVPKLASYSYISFLTDCVKFYRKQIKENLKNKHCRICISRTSVENIISNNIAQNVGEKFQDLNFNR